MNIDPKAKNWKYSTVEKNDDVLDTQALPFTLLDKDSETGYILAVKMKTDNPNVRLYVEAFDPTGDKLQLDATAEELNTDGITTMPGGMMLYCEQYDAVNSVYVIALNVIQSGIPYHNKLRVYAVNEDTARITVNEFSAARLVLT